MSSGTDSQHSSVRKHLDNLLNKLPDPVHKRIIRAYRGDNPTKSMESELQQILMEVLSRESQEH